MKPRTILYAEDDTAFAALYAKGLRASEYKYEVLLAEDGEEALRLYHEHAPDMVILDIKMAKMDGYQVLREIRVKDSVTPVIFLTNLSDERSAMAGYKAGVNEYIRKGISVNEFVERVSSHFVRHPVMNTPNRLNITSATYIDFTNNTISVRGHKEKIYVKDCNLLRLLVLHKNEQLSREFVETNVWGVNANRPGYIYKSTTRLRKILEKDEKIKLHAERNGGITLIVDE